jgi:hypothetical protein
MKQLQLIIPYLFPPRDIATEVCAGLHLPALEKLLARGNANTSPAETLEAMLCAVFGVQAVAPVRAAADGLGAGGHYCLCADPVSLRPTSSQVLLLPDVMPTQEEAAALCSSLNEHFVGMGLHFSAPHPLRWYVQMDAEPQMTTTPLRQVAWGDVKLHMPQGADALRWQSIATEAQMLLHAHPLNQARAERGELPVNSLWFWGGGWAKPLTPAFDAVGGDCSLVGGFARAAGTQSVDTLLAMLEGQYENGLWVCTMPGEALQRGDLYAWREAVQQVEQQFAQPLLKALQAGRLQRLTLNVMQQDALHRIELTRAAAWKLWRRRAAMARYAV